MRAKDEDARDEVAGPRADRRGVLKCMAWAGTGLVWTIGGGVASSTLLGCAQGPFDGSGFSFLQVSDSHIGFNKPPNPDARATYREAVARMKATPVKPDFIIHTGDITHLSRDEEFDDAWARSARSNWPGSRLAGRFVQHVVFAGHVEDVL